MANPYPKPALQTRATPTFDIDPVTEAAVSRASVGTASTDLSGTVATGGTSQALVAAAARARVTVTNPGTASLWVAVNGVEAAVNGQGSIQVAPGTLLSLDGPVASTAINITGPNAGQVFTAWSEA